MKKDIFTRLRNGEAIDMQTDEDYKGTAWNEVERTMNLCWKANSVPPFDPIVRQSLDELFQGILSASSTILPPFQLDFACQMEIGEGCFINHGLTVNHDFENTWIIKCKPVRIKKKAWIGAKAIIMLGVTIGEGAVIGSGAIVTKDVPDHTIAVGNPARVIKKVG
ncbi:DapH/DapD/GlmU-related protein [Dialister hominis]|uniref:DapH/DapD/GlmU-related protein n=1 Tax=Dialister hominis TaxID=2582419 RepID=UPI003AB063F2